MIPTFKSKSTQQFFYKMLESGEKTVKRESTPSKVYKDLQGFDKNYFDLYKRHVFIFK